MTLITNPKFPDHPLFTAQPPLSLYVHVPWCVRKCPYCDFNSHEVKEQIPEDAYIEALMKDIEFALPSIWGRKIQTIFFGGGTPSLLSEKAMDRILTGIRTLLPLEFHAEITLEANPGTVEASKFKSFRESGVNRLSLGIQSFNPQHLKALGRIHDEKEAKRAIEIAMGCYDNVNLDLMYGLPEQSVEQAISDLTSAASFGTNHLSAYHLTIEPNTPFHHAPPKVPDEDTMAEMQEAVEQILEEAGNLHYETSAYARPGKHCRHNLNYWLFGDYLGIGPGAHSKLTFPDKVIRQMRHKHPKAWLDHALSGKTLQEEHEVKAEELPFEFMMNALRLNGGFTTSLFAERTGLPLTVILSKLEQAESRGLIVRDHEVTGPTELGRRFLNDLLQIFL